MDWNPYESPKEYEEMREPETLDEITPWGWAILVAAPTLFGLGCYLIGLLLQRVGSP